VELTLQEKLEAPFKPSQVSWRVGNTNQKKVARETGNDRARPTKGQLLAYIDARDAMERLDKACGFENWQCRYTLADNGLLICEIGIRVNGEWLWRANGAGDTQVEAEKGKCSDAFKRAAVVWGVGRYLYGLESPWVDLDQFGKWQGTPPLPEWATPKGYMEMIAKSRKEAA
jgi:hypothetical protein